MRTQLSYQVACSGSQENKADIKGQLIITNKKKRVRVYYFPDQEVPHYLVYQVLHR